MPRQEVQEALLSRALEGAANAILILERGGRIAWVNDAFCRLSGYAREEAIGADARLLRPARHGRDYERAMFESVLGGRPWQGEVVECRRDGSAYTVTQVVSPLVDAGGRVTHFVVIQQDVSAGVEERARLRHLAYHDMLTDLPNRAAFIGLLGDAIAQATARERHVAVMFLDLDRFKEVNDSLGHEAGDRLLKAVAARIRACIRRSDTVARLGGDEFAIVLRNLQGPEVADTLAQKLVKSIAQPFAFDSVRARTSASIGISLYPEDGRRADDLLARADAAMYQAKAQGRASYRFAR